MCILLSCFDHIVAVVVLLLILVVGVVVVVRGLGWVGIHPETALFGV